VEVSLPLYEETVAALQVTMGSEALAYHRQDMQGRWGDYFAGTRNWVVMGALASGADYVQAQRLRRVTQHKLAQLFSDVDAIVMPTTALPSPSYSDLDSLMEKVFGTIFTPYWDAVGNPALVVPMGFTESGLPLSLQIAGRPFDEPALLKVGDAYQSVTDWHRRVPPIVTDTTEGVLIHD
jgi:aspartyl-tRNA(Asn)/glutamyl-tRNA(Gln) amidotransferase subunit A